MLKICLVFWNLSLSMLINVMLMKKKHVWASKFSLSISEWYEFKRETICPATRSNPTQSPLLFPDAVRYKAVHLSFQPF